MLFNRHVGMPKEVTAILIHFKFTTCGFALFSELVFSSNLADRLPKQPNQNPILESVPIQGT